MPVMRARSSVGFHLPRSLVAMLCLGFPLRLFDLVDLRRSAAVVMAGVEEEDGAECEDGAGAKVGREGDGTDARGEGDTTEHVEAGEDNAPPEK